MLSKDDIKSINNMMIGRGQPIQRDYSGYNIGDFNAMFMISMLGGEYTDEECCAVLHTLSKYKNTQLTVIARELTEACEYYDDLMKKKLGKDEIETALQDAKRGENRDKSDYGKAELTLYEINRDNRTVSVGFVLAGKPEYINIFFKNYGGKWSSYQDGNQTKKCVTVTFEKLRDFLKAVETAGKYGYVPNKDLQEFIDKELDSILAKKEEEKPKEKLVLTDLNKKNSYGLYEFSLNLNDYEFNRKLWALKDKGLSYVESREYKDKVVLSIKKPFLNRIMSELAALGIDVGGVSDHNGYDNRSGNSLVDLSTLNLPFKPYDFQIEDAKEIVGKNRALIGHEMGMGKTFIATLVGASIPGRKLIICPESLRLNWQRELERVVPEGTDIRVLYSNTSNVAFGDYTIIGYSTVNKLRSAVINAKIDCVIVDEAHKIKAVNNYGTPTTKRASAVLDIADHAKYCYLMTGTPMPTRNKDLYNILKILKCDTVTEESFYKFGIRYCDGYNNGFGYDFSGSSNTDELHELLKPLMTRRLKADMLPDLKKQRQFIPITGLTREYKDIEKRLHNMEDDDTYMGLAMTGRRLLSKTKTDTCIDMAETILEADESVVIVTEFKETLDSLAKMLDTYGVSVIEGGMKDMAKQKAIDDFQSGRNKVAVINTVAGGEGITLTRASNMIICDYDWTPAMMVQVEDRICRTGQTKPCNIFYLYNEDSILDKIFVDMITSKSLNIDKVIDDKENSVDLSGALSVTPVTNGKSYLDLLKDVLKADKKKEKAEKKQKKGKRAEEKVDSPDEIG